MYQCPFDHVLRGRLVYGCLNRSRKRHFGSIIALRSCMICPNTPFLKTIDNGGLRCCIHNGKDVRFYITARLNGFIEGSSPFCVIFLANVGKMYLQACPNRDRTDLLMVSDLIVQPVSKGLFWAEVYIRRMAVWIRYTNKLLCCWRVDRSRRGGFVYLYIGSRFHTEGFICLLCEQSQKKKQSGFWLFSFCSVGPIELIRRQLVTDISFCHI